MLGDIILIGAILFNLYAAVLGWRAKRVYEALVRQYQHYVEALEAVVAQEKGL